LRQLEISGSRQVFIGAADSKPAGLFRHEFHFLGKTLTVHTVSSVRLQAARRLEATLGPSVPVRGWPPSRVDPQVQSQHVVIEEVQ
jgi:hypothetical protein